MRAAPHMMIGSNPDDVEGKRLDSDTVRRAWQFARPYRWRIAGFLATIIAIAVVDLIPVLIFREIIDRAIPESDRGLVNVLAVLAVTVALVEAGLGLWQRLLSAGIGEGLIYDLRVALFDHVQRMPVSFFTHTQTGSLTNRLNTDIIGAQQAVTGTLGQVVSNVAVLTTTLVAMVALQWQLSLLAFAVLPFFIIPTKRVGRTMQRLTREAFQLRGDMNAVTTERFGVGGALLVKLFGRHDTERESFAGSAARVRDIGVKQALYGRSFLVGLAFAGAIGTAVVYWIGAQMVISGTITIGTLVALAAYVVRLYGPLTSITNARVDLMTALVSFERVFELLDHPRAIDDHPGAVDLEAPRGRVELDAVWFRYPSADEAAPASLAEYNEYERRAAEAEAEGDLEAAEAAIPSDGWVLRGVSAVIEPGQMVALVGPSGAGKTTVANLVPRLYDVTEGTVRVDGHDVRSLTQESLRAAIGVVPQDPHLFHVSVGENLRYARPDATQAEVEAACRAARIHGLLASLPDGYDTVVGERGYRLSGGEKQRLAIARMLLKDPAIVILDEATSHLDAENEAAIQLALDTALEGRTSIVIAHRLSTVRAADQILVVDGGAIVEQGTHAELLAAGGLYAELYATLLREDTAPATPTT